jgi:hypothetical protein
MVGKKILIIGFGNMGFSHFKSFYKKKYILDIVEKKKNDNVKFLLRNNLYKKKFFLYKEIPKNQKYLLTISATQSKERFFLIKKFFETNSTKFLLLEKFCFLKLKHFDLFNKKFNYKTETFVNSWGHIVAKKIKIRKKLKNFEVLCYIEKGSLLSNITHILHFFNYLSKKVAINKFKKNNYKVVKSIKRKFYDELLGTIELEDLNKNKLTIKTKKNLKSYMTFFIRQKYPKINYKVSMVGKIISFYNSREKKLEFEFPFAKKTTYNFLKKCENGNFSYMPTFNCDYELSKKILTEFEVRIP